MNKTMIIFKDELRGFAKSGVMIGLWVGLPIVAILMFFFLPSPGPGIKIPMSYFIGTMIASLGGGLAGIMVAVNIVNEKTKKVYDLFVIRPIRRGDIIWAKFFAVFICVTLACILAMFTGVLVDLIQGHSMSPMQWKNLAESLVSASMVIAVSISGGIVIGVIAPNVLLAVLLVLYGTQNLAIIPMAPTFFGLPDLLWVMSLISLVITFLLMLLAAYAFRKREM
ncbi:MAG TPA: hypothetical protein ENJ82_08425 [Bacteroidetes bacterium]|nr:hypothetical protein [Bacteroidota bacterium]